MASPHHALLTHATYKLKSLDVIFLLPIVILGITTSLSDIRDSRIKNLRILEGLSYGMVVYLFFGYVFLEKSYSTLPLFLKSTTISFLENFTRWTVNLMISSIVSLGLWRSNIWAAGDAKLFICYAALIPIQRYSRIYCDGYFASFFLLLTTFMPAGVFLLINIIRDYLRQAGNRQFYGVITNIFSLNIKLSRFGPILKTTLISFLCFLLFQWMNSFLYTTAKKYSVNQNLILIISILSFKKISEMSKKVPIMLLFALFFVVALLQKLFSDTTTLFPIDWIGAINRTFFFIILGPVVQRIADLYTASEVKKTMAFAPWMFLGALIVWFF